MNRPLDEIFSFVERHYWRLQAGDVLTRCMEEGRITPMEQVVEALVFDGPHNLGALQEMLDEVDQRRRQLEDDLRQMLSDIRHQLRRLGVTPTSLSPERTLEDLQSLLQHTEASSSAPADLLNMLHNAREVGQSMQAHLELLYDLEDLLLDWLWGMAYHFAHTRPESRFPHPGEVH